MFLIDVLSEIDKYKYLNNSGHLIIMNTRNCGAPALEKINHAKTCDNI